MTSSDKVNKNDAAERDTRARVVGKKEVRKMMAAEDLAAKKLTLEKPVLEKPVLEKATRPNHRGRGRTPADKREAAARYNERKKIVFEAEERNFEHLVLFLASDGDNPNTKKKFYIMGGNSAIIYAYDIAPRIGRKNVMLRPMRTAIERIYVDFLPRCFDIGTASTTPTIFAISPIERKMLADTRKAHCGAISTVLTI